MVVGRGEAGVISVLAEPGALLRGATILLDAEECHHLQVRRASSGVMVRVLDGAGAVGEGVLERGARNALVHLERVDRVEPPIPLRLVVAAGDRDRFVWLAEKCAELGVSDLIPVETERTRQVSSRLRAGHLDKLRRRAREAIKQSGAAWAPMVGDLVSLEVAAERLSTGPRWLGDPAGRPAFPGEPPLAAVVGPEGGFNPGERAFLVKAGFEPIQFGPHIMRFETAAIAAAVLARACVKGAEHE
jgi:16S rRNA (uracil1498-N3)-methyltransferase